MLDERMVSRLQNDGFVCVPLSRPEHHTYDPGGATVRLGENKPEMITGSIVIEIESNSSANIHSGP